MHWNKKADGGPLDIDRYGQVFACSFFGLWKNLFYKAPSENRKRVLSEPPQGKAIYK
jgi:hypothetical protein